MGIKDISEEVGSILYCAKYLGLNRDKEINDCLRKFHDYHNKKIKEEELIKIIEECKKKIISMKMPGSSMPEQKDVKTISISKEQATKMDMKKDENINTLKKLTDSVSSNIPQTVKGLFTGGSEQEQLLGSDDDDEQPPNTQQQYQENQQRIMELLVRNQTEMAQRMDAMAQQLVAMDPNLRAEPVEDNTELNRNVRELVRGQQELRTGDMLNRSIYNIELHRIPQWLRTQFGQLMRQIVMSPLNLFIFVCWQIPMTVIVRPVRKAVRFLGEKLEIAWGICLLAVIGTTVYSYWVGMEEEERQMIVDTIRGMFGVPIDLTFDFINYVYEHALQDFVMFLGWIKDYFINMITTFFTDTIKSALSPNITMPEWVPGMPEMPGVPDMPEWVPGMPEMPGVPDWVPGMPEMPNFNLWANSEEIENELMENGTLTDPVLIDSEELVPTEGIFTGLRNILPALPALGIPNFGRQQVEQIYTDQPELTAQPTSAIRPRFSVNTEEFDEPEQCEPNEYSTQDDAPPDVVPTADVAADVAPPTEDVAADVAPPTEVVATDVAPNADVATDVAPNADVATDVAPNADVSPVDVVPTPNRGLLSKFTSFFKGGKRTRRRKNKKTKHKRRKHSKKKKKRVSRKRKNKI